MLAHQLSSHTFFFFFFLFHLTDHLELKSKPIIVTYGCKLVWATVQQAENCRLLMQVHVHFNVYVSGQASNLQLCVFSLAHKYSHTWDTRAKLNPCQQVLCSWEKYHILLKDAYTPSIMFKCRQMSPCCISLVIILLCLEAG